MCKSVLLCVLWVIYCVMLDGVCERLCDVVWAVLSYCHVGCVCVCLFNVRVCIVRCLV